jgi:hypothetical protein
MASDTCPPVQVSRTIEAPAGDLFRLLARSGNHPLIDGSGMVRQADPDVIISGVGDVFVMQMHNDEMGDYQITNHVTEFEPGRRITWEPVLTAASRAEDQADIGDPGHHRWTYDLRSAGTGSTVVTEIYDCSRAPEWLRKAVRNGNRWTAVMTRSLENLEALATASH